VRSAFACVRAALAVGASRGGHPPSPTTIANAADYAGTYTGEDGRVFEVEASARAPPGRGPSRSCWSATRSPGRATGSSPHEALERYALLFARDADGTVVEAFHGGTWFR
jgi:hypothetical protein